MSSAKTTDREGSEKCEKFSVLTSAIVLCVAKVILYILNFYWSFQVCFILGLIYKMSKLLHL